MNALTKKRQKNINRNNNFVDIAPGEGQIPTSVLTESEWDKQRNACISKPPNFHGRPKMKNKDNL